MTDLSRRSWLARVGTLAGAATLLPSVPVAPARAAPVLVLPPVPLPPRPPLVIAGGVHRLDGAWLARVAATRAVAIREATILLVRPFVIDAATMRDFAVGHCIIHVATPDGCWLHAGKAIAPGVAPAGAYLFHDNLIFARNWSISPGGPGRGWADTVSRIVT